MCVCVTFQHWKGEKVVTQHIRRAVAQLALAQDGTYHIDGCDIKGHPLGYGADFLCQELRDYEQALAFLDYLFISQLGETLGGDRMIVQIRDGMAYVGYDDDPHFMRSNGHLTCTADSFEQLLRDWLRVLEVQPQRVTIVQEGSSVQLLS